MPGGQWHLNDSGLIFQDMATGAAPRLLPAAGVLDAVMAYNESMSRKKKIRTEFRKDHQVRRRDKDLTRKLARDDRAEDRLVKGERITGKGALTRKRTVVGIESDP